MYRAVALLLLAVPAVPAADQLDRRDRDEPEVFLNLDGRSGTCDVMTFSPDGDTLYAGGDDKVVHCWPSGAAGLESGRGRLLRWPAWREQRGGIKTLALPPAVRGAGRPDGRVFVGGWGMKSGAVVLFDKDGQIAATTDREEVVMPEYPAMASTFTADGKGVIYGTSDGRLYHWDLDKTNKELGRHSVANGQTFNRPRLIRFFSDEAFLSVAQSGEVLHGTAQRAADGKLTWKIAAVGSVLDAFNKAFKEGKAPPVHGGYSVYRADLTADGAWLACSVQPNYLVLVSLQGGPARVERLDQDDRVVRSLAWDKNRRLAVGVTAPISQSRFWIEGNDSIRVYDDPTTGPAPKATAELKHTGRAEALAWDPTGFLAVAGGDNHEVRLHDLRPKAKATAGPMQVVRGKGRGLWQVRLGADGKSFQFRPNRSAGGTDPNESGAGDWLAYNFATGQPTPPTAAVAVLKTADGWTVEPTKNPFVWDAVHQGGKRKPLTLDPDRDEQPRCYCFLPATKDTPTKKGTSTRLLVGHYYGFSVFDLDVNQPAKRTMLATGHAGDVTSIATDAAGTWAITTSVDMTIAGWSLADWPSGGIGAKLEVGPSDKLLVTDTDTGGPAYEMGLSKGDEITLVSQKMAWPPQFGLPGPYLGGKRRLETVAGTPAAGKNLLDNPTPGVEHYVAWKRAGVDLPQENMTTFRRRPLWRFLPAFDEQNRFDNWVVWVWKTGHYATSTNGDFLLAWQLNDPDTISAKRPVLLPANQLRKQLQRPVDVRKLMQTRDLATALKELAGGNPQSLKFGAREPRPVRLQADPAVGRDGLPVEIDVDAQGRNPDLIPRKVEVWVNDHRVKVWDRSTRAKFAEQMVIPKEDFRAGDNQVTVLTFNAAGGRGEAKRTVTFARPEDQPRLLALVIGINDYSQSGTPGTGDREFGDLKAAVKDAQEIGGLWKQHTGKNKYYAEDKVVLKLGPDATQKQILAALDELVEAARPDDRVILFLAGHGDFIPVPDAAKGSEEKFFVFCCPDYTRDKFETTGVTGKMIFDRLAKCKGRQLVLLDACHSGEIATGNVIRALIPDGQGPTVLAACGQTEQSFEHPKVGNGLFTAAVVEALTTKFDKAAPQGVLDPKSLFAYVRGRVPQLLTETGKREHLQNPQAFPVNLARYQIAGK